MKRKLPIGIQTFRKIREEGCYYYVDKTAHVLRLVDSGLNNLTDITLDADYSTVCGYTEADLDAVFAPELPGLDRAAIRDWYNGYSWSGDERVYNPFDVLLLFRHREFRAHWFETGSPSFPLDTLIRREVPALALDGMVASDALLSAFDVGDIGTEALLFQTGYLTIRRVERRRGRAFHRLGYPNREVRQSLNESLLNRLAGRAPERTEQALPARGSVGSERLGGPGDAAAGDVRRHSLPVAHAERHRRLRRLLRKRLLLAVRDGGAGRRGGGQRQPGPGGHGGAHR